MKKLLDFVTTFSRDIGMTFGQDKCAYLIIEKGKIKTTGKDLTMNNVTLKEIEQNNSYKYLGQDENISYVGDMNKNRVSSEYFTRVKKIWKSNLSAFNKMTAHNMFAVAVLTPTYGILDWTIEEIKNIDIKTRKLLNMTGNFHLNSDIHSLYLPRSEGGRGLRSIQVAYECRIVSLSQHLSMNKNRNNLISYICQFEENCIDRVAKELLEKYHVVPNEIENSKSLGKKFLTSVNLENFKIFKNKSLHGYIARKIEEDSNLDLKITKSWTRNKFMTSEFEAYAYAIKEQEISTKFIKAKRSNGTSHLDPKCRLCKNANEDIIHIISSCPLMSARYYLPVRHDVVAKTLYNSLIRKQNGSFKRNDLDSPEYIHIEGETEYWWNVDIKTATRLKHNKPDLIIWERDNKVCKIVEFSCPADINASRKVEEKINIYGPLIRNLQIMYKDYKFKMLPVVIGALGTVPKATINSLKELSFKKHELNVMIRKLQEKTVKGTVQICKTFMRFSEY